jgi:SAM-dependent methyltransferase
MADSRIDGSLANRMRKKRFSFFLNLVDNLKPPYRILDVGGRQMFWEQMGFANREGISIDLLNLSYDETSVSRNQTNTVTFNHLVGNAMHMPEFADKSYDIVFSNSVIEHLTTFENQMRMANEIRRVGKRYFVQSPNHYFPVEPHFLVPFFQFLPLELRVRWIMTSDIFWHERIKDRAEAEEFIRSFRLPTRKDMQALFPDAKLYPEIFYGLVKSYSAYAGWDNA